MNVAIQVRVIRDRLVLFVSGKPPQIVGTAVPYGKSVDKGPAKIIDFARPA